MAFELKDVVPWGRNLDEYKKIFSLSEAELNRRIVSFGDGPASFNREMTKQGKKVVSLDPVYKFDKDQLTQRIAETKEVILEQTRINQDKFIWKTIKDIQELERIRMGAMSHFLDDFELGKKEARYVCHTLPEATKFKDLEFDLALSSHFLILYSQLGLDFHIKSIAEILRISRELRIFPIVNLNAMRSEVLDCIVGEFQKNFIVDIVSVDYEFQNNGNEMLVIKRK